MAISPRLNLRQAHSLVMTPQLQQAIKLLQLSNLDLAEFIETELEQNPFLMREEGAGTRADAGEDDHAGPYGTAGPDGAEVATDDRFGSDPDVPFEADFESGWESEHGDGWRSGPHGAAGGGWNGSENLPNLEQTLERTVSLRDHLLEQVMMDFAEPADRIIGKRLVDLVDEAGYLSGDLEAVAATLECSADRIEATLARMQRFDPAGVFARDLKECLALQLRDRNRLDPAMQALLGNLELLARRDARALMRICGVDAEDLADMVAEIRALDPKPGLSFDANVAQPIVPDVLMRAQNGGWVVELNSDTLPRVLVDRQYYARVTCGARDKHETEYISERLHAANWLVRALDQRARTILRVAREIVRQQDAFFRHGVEHLRPLVLRDIAQAIEMHESTVSRVTANKYLATPRGLFELKYFFTASIASTTGGAAHSAESVRQRIRALIERELPDAVLSDDGIADILQSEGLDIARRTVAKYREAMRIPSSVQRRREKAMRV